MRRDTVGRASARHRFSVVWVATLPFFFSLLCGCREPSPTVSTPEPVLLQFVLPLYSYYSYDNWIIDRFGHRILSSRYRTSWKVVDTSAAALGFQGVVTVIDSTFSTTVNETDSLIQTDSNYFRISSNGDVFEYGFIARLLAQRDSVVVTPTWDKLLSPSVEQNASWIVETGDSVTGGEFRAVFLPSLELVDDSINGVAMGVLAYHVEIAGANLALGLWVGGSPPAFLRKWDRSDVAYNRVFQELRVRRSGG